MQKRLLFIFIFVIFIVHLLFRIYSYQDRYTMKYDPEYWKQRYLQSQWVDPLSKKPIGDDGLYTYAAWEYIHGYDPTLLNPEMPFLGKYLLGLSILVFHNENIFALLVGIGALITYYVFSLQVFNNKLIAFIPVVLFSLESLFYEQLRAPFFDLLQLLFLFLIFITFLKEKYLLSALFLGFFAASKFPFMVVLPLLTMFIVLFVTRKKDRIIPFIVTLPLAFGVYVATYGQFFRLGKNFIDFLKVQKFIFTFYTSGANAPFIGSIFPLLFIGKWYTHFSTVIKAREWTIAWPIITFFSFLSLRWLAKKDVPVSLMFIWIGTYLSFLSFTPVFPRYLLLLLPFLYNLFIWAILKSIRMKS